MITREQALQHSPCLRKIAIALVVDAVVVVTFTAWAAWDYHHKLAPWVKDRT